MEAFPTILVLDKKCKQSAYLPGHWLVSVILHNFSTRSSSTRLDPAYIFLVFIRTPSSNKYPREILQIPVYFRIDFTSKYIMIQLVPSKPARITGLALNDISKGSNK